MKPPREPTPEMIAAGVAAWPSSLRSPTTLMTLVWRAMWDAAYDKPGWTASKNWAHWSRSDGAVVILTETPTMVRPWRGSRWHNGAWKPNHPSHNTATADAAINAIDRHWPNAMAVAEAAKRDQ